MNNIFQIREISTLSFNERVLQEAEDKRNPLMERLKFLGIFSSNMDEFFKVRVASIQRRIELGKKGMAELLEVVGDKARHLDERFRRAYDDIVASLAQEDIRILTDQDVRDGNGELKQWLDEYFRSNVLPTLVPIIIHKNQPFPQLTDGSLYFGVVMVDKKPRYAILEIPSELPRFVQLPNGNIMYIDDLVRYSLNQIFYIFKYETIEAYEFKISRDAELNVDDDFADSYIRKMERGLQKRKGGRPTRLVYDAQMPPALLQLLSKELNITKRDTLIGGGRYHNMKDLMRFPNSRPDLAFERMAPAPHPILDGDRAPMLDIVKRRDVLVTYPYQSFDHLVRLLREAAIDPKVRSIKMTLYRAARSSQMVNALFNAARNGKKVVLSVELQARFDEMQNIQISEKLQEVGATVVYGVPPMKVHGKLMLIERDGFSVAGLSTGNFNETTGRLYVDSTLLTADPRLTEEVAAIFGFLENAAKMRMLSSPKFKHLLVSPFNVRKTLNRLLDREAKKGDGGYVFLKVNHLTDEKIITRIRAAADAGVKMDLVVRTNYAMLPHKNIRAISILDRYLEHQRVLMFGNGPDRCIYLSSSDLMERNLDWRIEVGFPILAPEIQQQIADMMAFQVGDTCKARVLDETQSNHYAGDGTGTCRAQYDTYHYLTRASGIG